MPERPLKVGLVTGEFPPMQGGVGAFTQELAVALSESGHEVHVITSHQARPTKARTPLGDVLQPIRLEYGWLHPIGRRWRWPDAARIASVVLRQGLDIVNIQYQAAAYNMKSPAINLLPWRLKGLVPTVVTFHDVRVPYLFPKAGALRQAVVRFMARQAPGAIATNEEDLATLQTWRAPGSMLAKIPIGSNISAALPDAADVSAARRGLGLGPRERLLGYFGFLNPSKGAEELIAALAELDPSTHLVFVGGQTGSSDTAVNRRYLKRIRALIESLGLRERVHWTGFVSSSEVSTFLQAADLMVMPYRDGVSLRRGTLMAVLAHGRPLVTTAPSHPLPELVHGQHAWLTSAGDGASLAGHIRHLLADEQLRQRLGQGALATARQFSWACIAVQTADFYGRVLRE